MIEPTDPNCMLLCKAAILNGMSTAGCETSTCRRYCKVKKDCPNEDVGDSNSSQSDSSSSNSSDFGSLDGVRATYPVPQPVNSSIIASGVSVAYGAVNHTESDYQGNSIFPLNFNRYYNSAVNIRAGSLGKQWRHSYDRTIVLKKYGNTFVVVAYRPNGTMNKYDGNLESDPDVTDKLDLIDEDGQANDRWHYINSNEAMEIYDVPGFDLPAKLLSITNQAGLTQTFTYNASGQLQSASETTGKSLGFTYNSEGLLETLTASNNRIWQYGYDGNDRLESVTHPDATTTQYHYEKSGMLYGLTGVTDQRNVRYITYEYNGSDQGSGVYYGRQKKSVTIDYTSTTTRTIKNSKNIEWNYILSEQNNTPLITDISGPGCTSCSGNDASKIYDTNNNLTSLTQHEITTEWGDYDANRNPGYRIDAVGTAEERRTDFKYDPRFRSKVTKITVESVGSGKNKESILVYNDEGQLIEQTQAGFTPAGSVISQKTNFQYNGPLKQLSRIDGPRTDVTDITTLEYYPDTVSTGDNRARLKKLTLPDNIILADNIQYTSTGLIKQTSDTNDVTTQYDYYAGNERLKTITLKKSLQTRKTQWTYLPTGEVKTITMGFGSPAAITLTFNYDDARRLTSINDANGNSVNYILDDEGNPETINSKDSNGTLTHTLSQTYDDYNRLNLLTRTHANMDYDFDTSGTLNQLKNGKQVATQFDYDDLQRLAQVIQDPAGLNLQSLYQYDHQDNLVLIQDPKGNATSYEYDDLGNVLSVISPDTGTTTYQHDSAGNIISQTDAKNQTIFYTYDALNRLTQLDAPETDADLTYQYDSSLNGVGHLTSITHAQGKTEWNYTPFGEISEKREIVGNLTLITHYIYNTAGQVTDTTYPSGLKATNQYSQGITTAVKLDGQPLLNNIKHEPFGGVTEWTWSNNQVYSRQYLDSGLLKTFSLGPDTRTLEYDEATNINQLNDADQQSTVQYDNINRLTDISGGLKSYGYQYDSNGNRKQYKENDTNYNYTNSPSNNRLQAIDGPTIKNYIYDDNGNAVTDGIHTYAFNSRNRLIDVDNGATAYIHNGLGQRIAKISGGNNNVVNSITTTKLLQDDFTGVDGQVIDDQTDSLWQGGPWKFGISATILNNQAAIKAKKVLFAIKSITDNSKETKIKATLNRGLIQLKGITEKANIVAVDYDGVKTVNVKIGNQWWAKRQVLKTLTLPQGNAPIDVVITLKAGIARVVITDNGQTLDTGDLDSKILKTGESYQLQLKTIKINGQFTDMLVDNVEVTSTSSGDSNTGSTYFSYNSNGQLLGEYTSDGQVIQETVYLGGMPVAAVKGGVTYYIHADQLGTPRLISDTAGTIIWHWNESEPFGNETANEDPDGDGVVFTYNLRFPGQYYDAETGLHYNYFRSYDSSTGRYMESDPIGLSGGLNTYGYVAGNPLSNIDIFGLAKCSWRPQTPEGCEKLKKRINNLRNQLVRQRNNLSNNPQGLPTLPPYTGAPDKLSCQGHVNVYFGYKKNIQDAIEDFNKRCGGPGGTPTPTQNSAPSSSSDGNNTALKVAAGVATGVGAGYLFYRGVRMIPSVFFPLSIPANLAIP